MIDLKVFRNSLLSLPRLMGRHRCFSKIMANIFPPLCCVNTHLIGTSKLPDLQFIKLHLIISFWLLPVHLIPMEAVRV